jgi:hypothetical protein
MNNFKLRPNSGNLFRNTRKTEGSNDPDYRGELDVGGEAHWVNAWLKTDKNGSKFLSLSIKSKSEVSRQPVVAQSDDRDDPLGF